jgi:23S rRNA (adenine2030-N6)-methyltransferase
LPLPTGHDGFDLTPNATMNYRHAYHAGNFADVLKHAVLALVIEHLKQKPPPFRVIDTHAGAGIYDLSGEEAQKTGEWRDGIGRLLGTTLPQDIAEILEPYLEAVRQGQPDGTITQYPGSPVLARRLLRRGDVLAANEFHPEDRERLKSYFARDAQTKVLEIDAWMALKALLPPKERRGVVLIDPPFEKPGEFQRLIEGLAAAQRRFATGTVIVWYPVKDLRAVERFRRDAAAIGFTKLYAAELVVGPVRSDGELMGTGLLIVNPPFTLPAKIERLLPFLAQTLARGTGASGRAEWLAGEHVTSS